MLISDLITTLENIAPPDLAADGDTIGLQVGSRGREVRRVCVTLDVTQDIIDKAVSLAPDIIVAHHPLIHTPLAAVSEDSPVGRRVTKLIRSDIALYVMHTNFDCAPGGTNDVLADLLGLTDRSPLDVSRRDPFYKIAVFVPGDHVERVRDAMAETGAGRIGMYTYCSFRTPGIGSFVPLGLAQPFIGSVGKLEEVEEYRLEMICSGSWLDEVLPAMLEAHPYEEVAYDVYELANEPIPYGFGRVGNLKSPTTLPLFAELVRSTLEPKYMKVEGDPAKPIRRVALCSGSGSGMWNEAVKAGADVYLTGDTKHHDILDANAAGLAIIDAGHYETETPGMRSLADNLRVSLAGSGVDVAYIE